MKKADKKWRLAVAVLGVIVVCNGCGDVGENGGRDLQRAVSETESAVVEQRTEAETTEAELQMTGSSDADSALEGMVQEKLESMTLEEKIAQMFVVLPEALTVTEEADADKLSDAARATQVGGIIYMKEHLQNPEQVRAMLDAAQKESMEKIGLPVFTCVDEEGGTVKRIGGREEFGVPDVGDMAVIGENGDVDAARKAGETIGGYLADLGFNVDFAPDADVLSNPDNQVVKRRSFGSDPEVVSAMAKAEYDGLKSQGVCGVYKHFPGHGATEGDTHEGYAYTTKTLEELRECELVPFQDGIENGVDFIMAAHISLPAVTGDDTPATLSEQILTGLLREEMGYDGIIITDAMNMGAIVEGYSAEDAAVMAIQAGADMILMPVDYASAYEGVAEAVKNGTISEERIDESICRVLCVKMSILGAAY